MKYRNDVVVCLIDSCAGLEISAEVAKDTSI